MRFGCSIDGVCRAEAQAQHDKCRGRFAHLRLLCTLRSAQNAVDGGSSPQVVWDHTSKLIKKALDFVRVHLTLLQ